MRVVDMPADVQARTTVARWLVEEWRHLFPDDDIGWYLGVWMRADATGSNPPHAVVALLNGEVVGTASMVHDDELPGAIEPGPWIAAVYVVPEHRGIGAGRAMMHELMSRRTGPLWLYTENETAWYESMGWRAVRRTVVNGHPVTVMTLDGPAEVD